MTEVLIALNPILSARSRPTTQIVCGEGVSHVLIPADRSEIDGQKHPPIPHLILIV
jgi:hypothetical protein